MSEHKGICNMYGAQDSKTLENLKNLTNHPFMHKFPQPQNAIFHFTPLTFYVLIKRCPFILIETNLGTINPFRLQYQKKKPKQKQILHKYNKSSKYIN